MIRTILTMLAEQVSFFGSIVASGTAALGFALAGRTDVAIVIVLLEMSIIAVVSLIRALYRKPRPKPRAAQNAIELIDAQSFPSFHATRATALAITVGTTFGMPWTIITGVGWFAVCAARLWLRAHDWRDILAGTILGATLATAVRFALGF